MPAIIEKIQGVRTAWVLLKDPSEGEDDFGVAHEHDEKGENEEAAEGEEVVKGLVPPSWKAAVCHTLRKNCMPRAIFQVDHPENI